ncbi:MAG: aminoacyl-tRNA hydrolase [Spirochaetia bacterium]|nr:aminoacyl-tRNA hydrolase [Spirochaetota bacterium]MCX8096009.1 aminoacyl-tRNA hydrolase [Spirochaetota bacterium]MDW8111804.1 aminoacyl-tRNA hydrolase [Spirochaetia bacterium]
MAKSYAKLIVGLGNIGSQYTYTRHNIGFMAIDVLAKEYNVKFDIKKKKSALGIAKIGDKKVALLKPQTYMNISGEPVLYTASFLKIPPEDIIVVCDDVSLQVGKIRIRKEGSSGGHNGLKSVAYYLKTDLFPRIRIGIGEPPEYVPLENWVLSNITLKEYQILSKTLKVFKKVVEVILFEGIDSAMNKFNGLEPEDYEDILESSDLFSFNLED